MTIEPGVKGGSGSRNWVNMIMPSWMRTIAKAIYFYGVAALLVVPVVVVALIARGRCRRRVAFGPEPMINNVHHAKALRAQGYEVTTFVSHVYYITQEFDLRWKHGRPWNHYALFAFVVWRCKILYIYFNGGPLGWTPLRGLEPWLMRLAGVRVVALPYGGDVQDFGVHDDVVYRNAYLNDYPQFIRKHMASRAAQVGRWCRGADWVVSGCDWVRYMPWWDSLMLAHFSVDTAQWTPPRPDIYSVPTVFSATRPLRILHAPNHRAIKGTPFLVKVVEQLQGEGLPIEFRLLEKVPNDRLRTILSEVDIVVEQLVIGWHGIFALEAMALAKPVFSYIAPELERLYILNGLLESNELPIIRVDHQTLETELRAAVAGRIPLAEVGRKSRAYVLRHHSLEIIGAEFARINTRLGLAPGRLIERN